MLRSVKSARNAAAHSSNVVNGFRRTGGATFGTSASFVGVDGSYKKIVRDAMA